MLRQTLFPIVVAVALLCGGVAVAASVQVGDLSRDGNPAMVRYAADGQEQGDSADKDAGKAPAKPKHPCCEKKN